MYNESSLSNGIVMPHAELCEYRIQKILVGTKERVLVGLHVVANCPVFVILQIFPRFVQDLDILALA